MTADRSLWYESHLFADRAGRRAREACERLGSHPHHRILAAGDHLATTSIAVAQQFFRAAAPAWHALGPEGFEQWLALGESLVAADCHRDAALAYFGTTSAAVAALGVEGLHQWCEIGRRLSRTSRRLGTSFFETSAPLLDRVPIPRLDTWARHGARLHGVAGWRGEFLAHAYLKAAGPLAALSDDELGAWADLGVALQSVLKEAQYFGTLPDGLDLLSPSDRGRFFTAARAIARVKPAAAAIFYKQLPAALRRLGAGTRSKLLEIFETVGAAAATSVGEVVPVVGALVHAIPKPNRLAALELTLSVGRSFPRGSVALLRSLPTAYEDAPHAAIERWVHRGLEVAGDNDEAGLAYFALESRTSIRVLQAGSTSVTLDEVQGLLRKYVQMLSGRSVSIRSADVCTVRSPLEDFPLEDEIALPIKVDLFPTHEDNVRVYRFLAGLLAGRREFGTYEGTLPPNTTGLLAYLRQPEQPDLLEDIFLVTEGFRVAAALSRGYPGLAAEQRLLATQLLNRAAGTPLPSPTALFDTLLTWLLSGQNSSVLPHWLRSMAALVAPAVAPLAVPSATVDDALRVAELLTRLLTESGERPMQRVGDRLLEQLSGESLIDQYLYDDGPDLPSLGEQTAPANESENEPEPLTLPEDMQFELEDDVEKVDGATTPLSAEELQRLIEAGVDLRLKQGYSDDTEGLGLYISDLFGKLPPEQLEELRQMLKRSEPTERPAARRWMERRGEGVSFYYDEWDYLIADYRQRWCRLREVAVDGDSGEFFTKALGDYAALIPEVRRQFQRIRPEMYRVVRGLEDGEDFDLNAVVNARVERRAHRAPSSKLYTARTREERDVATLFLIDMSASTDEPMEKPAEPETAPSDNDDLIDVVPARRPEPRPRRIIDLTKEALVIMAEALEEIGDAYAIYGFSGHGRENVEFYLVKSFNESLNSTVKGRIGALEPKRSTRMGTALRHATEKMASVSARSRHIILLSDGFPQDFDYGQDRRSNVYGLRDTTMALREVEASGVTPFCITVDKAGHDYLREMCDGSRYMVIDDIFELPRELPKIYQRVIGA